MLSKENRLRKREDFTQVFRFGRPIFLDGATVFVRGVANSQTKVGVAFKKKAFPRATNRNYYKRRMLSATSPFIGVFPGNLQIVILFQKLEKQISYSYFLQLVQALLKILNSSNTN